MIEIIPAISVIDGRCVKKSFGSAPGFKEYDVFPLQVAQELESHGIKQIHLIDLDGAKSGHIINWETLESIANYTQLDINFSGGITNDGDIRLAFECGADKVTASSLPVRNRELFDSWLITYGRNKVILAADSKEEKIITGSWNKPTTIDLFDHVKYFYNSGIFYVKCTDVNSDGQLEGPPLELYRRLLKSFPGIRLLGSGGIRSIEDIKALEELGAYGAIFGKAYFEGMITAKDLEAFIISRS